MADQFHPIIYVRGYAMTQGEINDTTADPFCGFNLGSTVYRATPDKTRPAKKFIFESPVIRLHADFDYADVFENGFDIMDPDWTGKDGTGTIPRRSIIIYHYYEQASTLLGRGKTPSIEDFAKGLNELVLRVKELVRIGGAGEYQDRKEFRCHLVAHSMGGLVCRAFLQNPALGKPEARSCVDKFFTYATPHNGIDMAGMNVPSWLSLNDTNNFNRERMAGYLDLAGIYQLTKRVDWMPRDIFPPERIFCLIGTNRADYEVAMGASRTFAGHGSDGLVRIENASVWGIDGSGQSTGPCATAYAYRSHSGYFGIVNSEEAYQNLVRFLFGDLRVDLYCDIDQVNLPAALQGKAQDVDALYQFEVLASPRGKRWFLTRRTSEEDSVACRTHKELTDPAKIQARSIYLSTVFLGSKWKVDKERASLAYSMTFGVKVPDYELNKRLWFDEHYEGGYLFRDEVIIEITPADKNGDWQVRCRWQSSDELLEPVSLQKDHQGRLCLIVPFGIDKQPGITGKLRFVVMAWG